MTASLTFALGYVAVGLAQQIQKSNSAFCRNRLEEHLAKRDYVPFEMGSEPANMENFQQGQTCFYRLPEVHTLNDAYDVCKNVSMELPFQDVKVEKLLGAVRAKKLAEALVTRPEDYFDRYKSEYGEPDIRPFEKMWLGIQVLVGTQRAYTTENNEYPFDLNKQYSYKTTSKTLGGRCGMWQRDTGAAVKPFYCMKNTGHHHTNRVEYEVNDPDWKMPEHAWRTFDGLDPFCNLTYSDDPENSLDEHDNPYECKDWTDVSDSHKFIANILTTYNISSLQKVKGLHKNYCTGLTRNNLWCISTTDEYIRCQPCKVCPEHKGWKPLYLPEPEKGTDKNNMFHASFDPTLPICYQRFEPMNATDAQDHCKSFGSFLPQPLSGNVDSKLCEEGETWLDFKFRDQQRPGWYKQTFEGFANRIMPSPVQEAHRRFDLFLDRFGDGCTALTSEGKIQSVGVSKCGDADEFNIAVCAFPNPTPEVRIVKPEKGCANFLKTSWEFYGAGGGDWFVQDEDYQWTLVDPKKTTGDLFWLTKEVPNKDQEIKDGTVFKYVCNTHTGDKAYGAVSFLKGAKKQRQMKKLNTNGRKKLDDKTSGAYYQCKVDQHRSVSVCLSGDVGLGTDEQAETDDYCSKKKKLLTYKNVEKNFNAAMAKWKKANKAKMDKCVKKLGKKFSSDYYTYNNRQLFVWKKAYGKSVGKNEWIVKKGFPVVKKATANAKKRRQPSCKKEFKTKNALKKVAKDLSKVLEKSPNYCA